MSFCEAPSSPTPTLRKVSRSKPKMKRKHRVCYICKTNFWMPIKEEDSENILKQLAPLADRGIHELCSVYEVDAEAILHHFGPESSVQAKLRNTEAFCQPCLRHLYHIGKLSEEMEDLKAERNNKIFGLAELMVTSEERPPFKRSRESDSEEDVNFDELTTANSTTGNWSKLRENVAQSHSSTHGLPEFYVKRLRLRAETAEAKANGFGVEQESPVQAEDDLESVSTTESESECEDVSSDNGSVILID